MLDIDTLRVLEAARVEMERLAYEYKEVAPHQTPRQTHTNAPGGTITLSPDSYHWVQEDEGVKGHVAGLLPHYRD